MSRSGYSYDGYDGSLAMYRGNVANAIRGRRGQMFLQAIRTAMLAMPEKKLEESVLVGECGVCAMGALAQHMKLDTGHVDEFDPQQVGALFGVAWQLAAEIAYENDENSRGERLQFQGPRHKWDGGMYWGAGYSVTLDETPVDRWKRMMRWLEANIEGAQ